VTLIVPRLETALPTAAEPAPVEHGGPRTAAVAASILLAGAALVPLLIAAMVSADVRGQLVAGSLGVALLASAGLVLVGGLPGGGEGISRWRVGHWYLLWSLFAFGVSSITWLQPQTGSAAQIALDSVVAGLAICAVTLVAWLIGYVLGPPRPLVDLVGGALARVYRGSAPAFGGGARPWLLYGAGLAARLVTTVLSGRLGYVGDPSTSVTSAAAYAQALTIVATLCVFAVAVAAYRYFASDRREGGLTLLVLVTVEIGIGAVGGTKESFVTALLAVLIPYGALRGRLPRKALVASVLLFLLVVIPFNQAYRQAVRDTSYNLTPSQALQIAPEVLSRTVGNQVSADGMAESGSFFLRRIRMLDNVAIIHQKTPVVIPYRSPAEFLAAPFIGLTPRALWPGKPILAGGYRFTQEYYGLPSSVYTSTPVTPQGDLFRHGGWAVLAGGMVLFGLVCRLLDRLLRPERDPRAIFFLLVFLPVLVKSEVDVNTLIATFPVGIVTALLGIWLACPRTRRTAS
jgi:hypothetical protein